MGSETKDAFDTWREWTERPLLSSPLTIPPEIYAAVMTLAPEERLDRTIVNEAVRTGRSPVRPPGSAERSACRRRNS